MKRFTPLLAIALLAVAVAGARLAGQANNVESIMRGKLERAQMILDGVATADFEKIRVNADQLVTLTEAAEWQVLKNPDYVRHSENFRAAVKKLSVDAKARNFDAASLHYVEMTLSCIACHKAIRDVGVKKPL